MTTKRVWYRWMKGGRAALLAAALACAGLLAVQDLARAQQQEPSSSVRPPAGAVAPSAPGTTRVGPDTYEGEMWRKVRGGLKGQVTIPDTKAGQLVDSSGEEWRNMRMGPLPYYGAWAMGGMLLLLLVFLLVRGRIQVEHGWAGRTITRFDGLERAGHWLLAVSFIILAVTGLNLLYGRTTLLPVIGKEHFALLTEWGKWLHNYVAFAFMVGLVWVFLTWVLRNLPHWRDLQWIAMGGGLIVKGVHPPAWKFNFGQKVVFWLVILGGISLSLSGLSLMFPYQFPMFAKTFEVLNTWFGLGLPTALTVNEEMQYAQVWHTIVALGLICVIIAHIYIGTLGMQGAFSAMGSGEVDENWAKEHHSLWAKRVLEAKGGGGTAQPHAHPQPAE